MACYPSFPLTSYRTGGRADKLPSSSLLISFCPALPCPALPCPALPCPVLSCPVLSCPALLTSVRKVISLFPAVVCSCARALYSIAARSCHAISFYGTVHDTIYFRDAKRFIDRYQRMTRQLFYLRVLSPPSS